jgi:hypothetical protein
VSERNDNQYAEWWEPIVAFLILFFLIIGMNIKSYRDTYDLQRRVGQLESEQRR